MIVKKFFASKKAPVRFIYEDIYGTSIGPNDEIEYYLLCLREIVNIIWCHIKNFFGGKNEI